MPVYYFALYRKQKAATIERIRNSAEYQQQCTAARMATNRQQQEFDEAYTKAKEEYDSVLLGRVDNGVHGHFRDVVANDDKGHSVTNFP